VLLTQLVKLRYIQVVGLCSGAGRLPHVRQRARHTALLGPLNSTRVGGSLQIGRHGAR